MSPGKHSMRERFAAWRRRKHEPPYTDDEMAVFRCRVQALVRVSRNAKAAES